MSVFFGTRSCFATLSGTLYLRPTSPGCSSFTRRRRRFLGRRAQHEQPSNLGPGAGVLVLWSGSNSNHVRLGPGRGVRAKMHMGVRKGSVVLGVALLGAGVGGVSAAER